MQALCVLRAAENSVGLGMRLTIPLMVQLQLPASYPVRISVPVRIRLVMNVLAHIWVTVLTLVSCITNLLTYQEVAK